MGMPVFYDRETRTLVLVSFTVLEVLVLLMDGEVLVNSH
jgi:hypothetical protein